jgi:hypothetical protein
MDEIIFPQHDVQTKWMSKYNLYQLLRTDSSLMTNPDLASFSSGSINSNMAKLMHINDLITQGDHETVNTLLSAIIPENEVEENLITVYGLEANKTDEGYTEDQLNELQAIAEQCPYSAGYAVYNARAILRSEDPTLEFTNSCEITTRNFSSETKMGNTVLKLYPNPAVNLLNIETDLGVGMLKVYNIVGELILSVYIRDVNTQISMEEIPAGIYTYKLDISNKAVDSGKLVIIK